MWKVSSTACGSVTTTTSRAPRRATSSTRVGRGSSRGDLPRRHDRRAPRTRPASSRGRCARRRAPPSGRPASAASSASRISKRLRWLRNEESMLRSVSAGTSTRYVGASSCVQGDDLVDVDRLERLLGEHDDRRRGAAVDLLALARTVPGWPLWLLWSVGSARLPRRGGQVVALGRGGHVGRGLGHVPTLSRRADVPERRRAGSPDGKPAQRHTAGPVRTGRDRGPRRRDGWPRRCPNRSLRSRRRRSSAASTSRPWPPRWARP